MHTLTNLWKKTLNGVCGPLCALIIIPCLTPEWFWILWFIALLYSFILITEYLKKKYMLFRVFLIPIVLFNLMRFNKGKLSSMPSGLFTHLEKGHHSRKARESPQKCRPEASFPTCISLRIFLILCFVRV